MVKCCRVCNRELQRPRQSLYCSDACKMIAYRLRVGERRYRLERLYAEGRAKLEAALAQ